MSSTGTNPLGLIFSPSCTAPCRSTHDRLLDSCSLPLTCLSFFRIQFLYSFIIHNLQHFQPSGLTVLGRTQPTRNQSFESMPLNRNPIAVQCSPVQSIAVRWRPVGAQSDFPLSLCDSMEDKDNIVNFIFVMEDGHGSQREQCIVEEKDIHSGAVINRYLKGKLLGKGGFAKCYEFTHVLTNKKYAAKVIEKATLVRSKAREKLTSEIKIHKAVKSQFVVRYEKYFEDASNVYIILELCTNQTLNELIKRRKRITQLEARYYMRQIALAVKDFQAQMIIHRDLKLGNLLLTEQMEIRISDFGLAAKLNSSSERRKTMCGTPNYIAPEILENNDGHSYQVDIWSMGVIAYAFLVGRPPFETNDVKATYSKIKMCSYSFPDGISLSPSARHFISKMLQKDPRHRATIDQILTDEFLTKGAIPQLLPTATLACPPNANFLKQFQSDETMRKSSDNSAADIPSRELLRSEKGGETIRAMIRTNSIQSMARNGHIQRAASTAAISRGRMISCLEKKVPIPLVQPFVWIVYFEENPKFGLAYLLNSNATGMKFNDTTSLIGNSGFTRLKYSSRGRQEEEQTEVFEVEEAPEKLSKKLKIISYYQKELRRRKESEEATMPNEQLIQRERLKFRQNSENALGVVVSKHCKTSKANVFWFNTKDLQIIFKDFTEILISKDNFTYVNKAAERVHFTKQTLDSQSDDIKKRVKYTVSIVEYIKEGTKNQSKESRENKENKPEETQMGRCSSAYRLEKPKPIMMRGCASTSRLLQSHHNKVLKH